MNKLKQILLIGIFSCVTSNVTAMPVSGSLDMFGMAPVLLDANSVSTSIASDAVTVDFAAAPNNFIVVAATDDLLGLRNELGTIKDLPFDPFAGPIVDFWTVGGFSFDLSSIVRGASSDPATVLVLNGTGLIRDSSAFYEDTAATWSFSTDTTGSVSMFSWNAVAASSVPEPGVLMLVTMGLLAFSLRKRV